MTYGNCKLICKENRYFKAKSVNSRKEKQKEGGCRCCRLVLSKISRYVQFAGRQEAVRMFESSWMLYLLVTTANNLLFCLSDRFNVYWSTAVLVSLLIGTYDAKVLHSFNFFTAVFVESYYFIKSVVSWTQLPQLPFSPS